MVKLTPHQMNPCYMCAEDASKYNHCAFCGTTFKNVDDLLDHLDSCEFIEEALGG